MNTIEFLKCKLNTPEIKYTLLMFFITRIILSIIGALSRRIFETKSTWTGNLWLDMWGTWDTGWYLRIAELGYNPLGPMDHLTLNQNSIVFFPLYPSMMRFLGSIVGNNYVAGLIISNLCLIVSCIYLYRLVRLDSDEKSATRAIKYLLLFPISFILSGVFTESLYLALTLMCFYYARTGRWKIIGIIGFFLALTRSVGILLVFPLLYEGLMPLIKENRSLESYKKAEKKRLPLLYLFSIPLGLISFMIFNFYLDGDFLAFAHAQAMWGRHPVNPLATLIDGFHGDIYRSFEAIFTTFSILIFIGFFRKIRFSYWLFGIYSILLPLSTGLQSMPRYILVIFPIYIFFANITKNRFSEELVTVLFALLQGCLMVFWSNNFKLVI